MNPILKTRPASLVAAILLTGVAVGCHSAAPPVEKEAPLLSVLKMNDPQASSQLTKGFYDITASSWRWTAGAFSVTLKTPPGANKNGAVLSFQLTVPEAVIRRLKSVTLTASVQGANLAPESYNAQGGYVYTRDVPASMLNSESVAIDFIVKPSLPPGTDGDSRNLGVIAQSVGLVGK